MTFTNLPVGRKLWLSATLVLTAMAGTALISQYSASSALGVAMDDIQRYENRITLAVRWKGMTETNTQRVIANALATDPLIPQTFAPQLAAGIADIGKLHKTIADGAHSSEERQALAVVAQRRGVVLDLLKTIDTAKQAARSSGQGEALGEIVDRRLLPAVASYLAGLDAFVKVEEDARDAARLGAVRAADRASLWGLLAMAALFSGSLIGVAALARSISCPLEEAAAAAERIAGGDLRGRMKGRRGDEIGRLMQAMDRMADRLGELVSQVRSGVECVATASQQIATGNSDLSLRTEHTASNLQQAASSMEQLTDTVSQSADKARQANELASSAAQAAQRGGEMVDLLVESMARIADSSSRIAEIIGVIDGIAFQTNILALNAAVEAARAGEQGRGFAVVASEVRSLAKRSADAAREIKSLIDGSTQTVADGSGLAAETGTSMKEIVGSVRRVSTMIDEISTVAGQQHDGISQVNRAVSDLDQMTQQNAALVEESAAAAQSLREQALRLADQVSVFKLGGAQGEGDAGAALEPVAPVALA